MKFLHFITVFYTTFIHVSIVYCNFYPHIFK
nr:MAG TPA: hypothetical protein [Caudoviricetes sp.]